MGYGTHATDVVGYTFNADVYCVDHTREVFGDLCDGFTPCPGHNIVRDGGHTFNIADCYDESSFDSNVFPKVIFASSVEGPDRCGKCGEYLVGDASDYESNEDDEK